MQRITIQVTEEMIEKAVQRHRGDCAIAIGIRYANNRLGWAAVDRDVISISDRDDGLRRTWTTPKVARIFIDTFDLNRSAVKPFSFTLDPDDAMKTVPMTTTPPLRRTKPPTGRAPANKGQQTAVRKSVIE